MKTRRLLALVAVLLATATLWANAVPILGPAPTAEGLRRLADNARLYAGLFGYGAPVHAAYFQGRADAYAEIAAQIEASQPRTPTIQPGAVAVEIEEEAL